MRRHLHEPRRSPIRAPYCMSLVLPAGFDLLKKKSDALTVRLRSLLKEIKEVRLVNVIAL